MLPLHELLGQNYNTVSDMTRLSRPHIRVDSRDNAQDQSGLIHANKGTGDT